MPQRELSPFSPRILQAERAIVKRLYLHIGTEKTGTKTLQKFLCDHAQLLKRFGVSYLCDPRKSYVSDGSHFPVVACLNPELLEFVPAGKRQQFPRALAQLHQDLVHSGSQVAVVSNEHFSSRLDTPTQLMALKQVFAGFHVHIVCYLRRQDELALSSYSTGVMCGRRAPFSLDEVNLQNRYFNYAEMLRIWEGAFGRENIIVRPFGKTVLTGADIRRDFLSVIGIDPLEAFVFREDLNHSLDATQVEAMRLVNQHLPALEDGDRVAYDHAQAARIILAGALPRGKPLGSLLDSAARELLHARFRESNAEVESRYLAKGGLGAWGVSWSCSEAPVPAVTPVNGIPLASVTGELAMRLATVEQEIFAMRRSRSWRWTRPLRDLKDK